MHLKIASPCKKDWAKMSGDDKVRACGECKLNVYNLSAMTEAEVQELVQKREGRLCVRFYLRPDGTVLTRDCPVGVGRKRRTWAVSLAAMATLFATPVLASTDGGDASAGVFGAVRSFVHDLGVKLGLVRPVMMGDMG